jgi:hypothetical protein
MYRLFALLLFSTLAFAQAKAPGPKPATPATKPPSAQSGKPAAPPATSTDGLPAEKNQVALTAAVITIDGVCGGKIPAKPTPGCQTVVTRAEFERLADALDPRMPAQRRQQLADAYSRMLVMTDAAEQRGLDKSPEAQEVLRFMRMQTLMQLLLRDLQKEATNVPAAEVEKYYNEHPEKFEEAALLRLFIPKTPPGGEKGADDKTLQAEAEKIRAAAVSGGDFEKLEKQAYDDLGLKTPPPTSAGMQRRENLPASQAKVFDLQPGKVSEVLDEAGGLYIFKIESKKKVPLPEATAEINRTLESERMKAAVEKLTSNVKTVLSEEYFGATPASGGPAVPGMPARRPGGPGTPPSGAPATHPPSPAQPPGR